MDRRHGAQASCLQKKCGHGCPRSIEGSHGPPMDRRHPCLPCLTPPVSKISSRSKKRIPLMEIFSTNLPHFSSRNAPLRSTYSHPSISISINSANHSGLIEILPDQRCSSNLADSNRSSSEKTKGASANPPPIEDYFLPLAFGKGNVARKPLPFRPPRHT